VRRNIRRQEHRPLADYNGRPKRDPSRGDLHHQRQDHRFLRGPSAWRDQRPDNDRFLSEQPSFHANATAVSGGCPSHLCHIVRHSTPSPLQNSFRQRPPQSEGLVRLDFGTTQKLRSCCVTRRSSGYSRTGLARTASIRRRMVGERSFKWLAHCLVQRQSRDSYRNRSLERKGMDGTVEASLCHWRPRNESFYRCDRRILLGFFDSVLSSM